MTKSQIDKLGERLRKGPVTESDLQMLSLYRQTFLGPLEQVLATIGDRLQVEVTARRAKSTESILQKLRREKTRLSRMQDVAGCRLVVMDIQAQDSITSKIVALFNGTELIDRRAKPSHGYRAMHAIVRIDDKSVEIQVRTKPRHLWAEASERIADRFGHEFKYGGGSGELAARLIECSQSLADFEDTNPEWNVKQGARDIELLESILFRKRDRVIEAFNRVIEAANRPKGQ